VVEVRGVVRGGGEGTCWCAGDAGEGAHLCDSVWALLHRCCCFGPLLQHLFDATTADTTALDQCHATGATPHMHPRPPPPPKLPPSKATAAVAGPAANIKPSATS
jgi:hypothetical protein